MTIKRVALNCRLATPDDLATIADLRWRLQMDDAADDATRQTFVEEFLANDLHTEDLFHFVAEDEGRIISAMSVRKVWKMPAPGRPEAAWGYLTNCYVLPDYRAKGVGSALLKFIKGWSRDEQLELLVVWPSDPAYEFYKRAGFAKYQDPLVLKLEG